MEGGVCRVGINIVVPVDVRKKACCIRGYFGDEKVGYLCVLSVCVSRLILEGKLSVESAEKDFKWILKNTGFVLEDFKDRNEKKGGSFF